MQNNILATILNNQIANSISVISDNYCVDDKPPSNLNNMKKDPDDDCY